MATALLLSSAVASRLLVDGQSYQVDKGLEVNCAAISGLTEKDQMAIMRDNAMQLYRLDN